MAKGRRLTSSLSERYLGSYAGGHSHNHTGSELFQEDVWSTLSGDNNSSEFDETATQYNYCGSEWKPRVSTGSARTTSSRIARQFRAQDAVVSGGPQTRRRHHMATSAPMNVPDWGKILRVNSSESIHDSEDGFSDGEPDSAVDPPHEYLARSRKTAATSVFEGVGRTLKGRDMSRLRDAVWSQTGFSG